MVKTVFESDASLRNYNKKTKEIILDACMHASALSGCVRWNVQLVRRFLCGNELIFNHPTSNFYATSWQKCFCAASSELLCIRSAGSAVVPYMRVCQPRGPEWLGWLGRSISYLEPRAPNSVALYIYIPRKSKNTCEDKTWQRTTQKEYTVTIL